jgi:hypothetical protein
VSGPECVLVEHLRQRHRDPTDDLGPCGVPRDPVLIGCFPTPIGRSAFPGKTRPIRVNAELRTNARQTKPIRPERQERTRTGEVAGGLDAGTAGTNEANCRHGQRWTRAGEDARGGVAGADCAKQTQFTPPRPEEALPGQAGSTTDPRGNCAKQSQLPPSNTEGKYFMDKEL